MEKIYYELKPVLFLGLGTYGIFWSHHNRWSRIFGGLLIFCGVMIVLWRMKNRGLMK